MMYVDLDFAPTGAAVLRQATHQSSIVLLSRIKIRMPKRKTVVVVPLTYNTRVVSALALYPLFLFTVVGTCGAVARNNRRLKMISDGENHMDGTTRRSACEALPNV